MDESDPGRPKRATGLASAIRAARVEEADRSQAFGDLRGAEVARLELLREAVEPVFAEVPAEIDMFDVGIASGGERPRLFIDMITSVVMDRDRRAYRLMHDTRHGRIVLAESDKVSTVVAAITAYVARRLVEREKMLASLLPDGTVGAAQANTMAEGEPPEPVEPEAPEPRARSGAWGRAAVRAIRIGIDGLGVLTLAALVWLGMQYVQGRLPPQW